MHGNGHTIGHVDTVSILLVYCEIVASGALFIQAPFGCLHTSSMYNFVFFIASTGTGTGTALHLRNSWEANQGRACCMELAAGVSS